MSADEKEQRAFVFFLGLLCGIVVFAVFYIVVTLP